jgi:hypothetical protein
MSSIQTEALLLAAEQGDMTDLVHAVKLGGDVRYITDEDHQHFRPPVKLAAEGGYVAVVHVLLSFGAFWWTYHWNGLAYAQENRLGEIEAVISARKAIEDTLTDAIHRDDTEEALASLDEDETLATAYEAAHGTGSIMPPLLHAAEMGNVGLIRRLIGLGANPAATCRASTTNAMTLARYCNHRAAMSVLARHDVVSGPTSDFLWAAVKGDLEKVKRFLMQGIDINEKDDCLQHVLPCAVESKNKDLIQFVLKEGADPNQSNGWEGYIWLMDVIADRDDTETIEMMLRNGYDPNSRDGRGSLLDVARKYGRSNTEALLQSYGAA